MSLELPTGDELTEYEDEGLAPDEALQEAADLFTLATGIRDTPSDPLAKRMIKAAILQMAWALRARHEDLEAVFSPFSSERIGSYSYTKMSQAIANREDTGVPLFDVAVAWFRGQEGGTGVAAVDSEFVFKTGERFGEEPWVHHDPSYLID